MSNEFKESVRKTNKIKILVIPAIVKYLSESYNKVDIRSTALDFAKKHNFNFIEVPQIDCNVTSVYSIEKIESPTVRKQGKKDGSPFTSSFPNSPPYYLYVMKWKGNGKDFDNSAKETLFECTEIERTFL